MIGLYIAYVIPIYLRWRMGDAFEPGPWTLGNKYKWMCIVAVVEVLIVVVIYFNLPFSSSGVSVGERLRVVAVQLHPGGDVRRLRRGRHLVAGERHERGSRARAATIDEIDAEIGAPPPFPESP